MSPFDQASRYLLRSSVGVLLWLLGAAAEALEHVQWLDTRRIPWPGAPERVCDTVAHLLDRSRHGVPWAVVIELQLTPDAEMPGRLLAYLGQVWLDLRPTDKPGDRFEVAAVVVNLTGGGTVARDMHWPELGLRTTLLPRQVNMAELSASAVLDDVEAGQAPRAVLAWLPLMPGGGEDAIIQRWLALAQAEPDAGRRADLGLALTFAEAADCRGQWEDALRGWNMVESQVVNEWKREAEMKAWANAILRALEKRLGPVPQDLSAAVQGVDDEPTLQHLLDVAVTAQGYDQFRRDTGL